MSSFHFRINSGKKGKAVNHAVYIAREGRHGKQDQQSDLIAKAHGNLPEWAHGNPKAFWQMADSHERTNGATYREFEVALPSELSASQNLELVYALIKHEIKDKPYEFAIHAPNAALGEVAQPHAHIMFSDRKPDGIERSPGQHFKRHNPNNPELGGCKKDSGGKDRGTLKNELVSRRENWAALQNSSLEKHGHTARVDHRSNRERGIEREPERHLGYVAIKMMSTEDKAYYKDQRQSRQQSSM